MEFAIFHGYSYWQQSKRQHLREQELMELNYQTEIKALKAQIEPHFLFNTLNSISASVPPSLEETRVLIAQLADTFRYALKMSERPIVSLEEEMEFVRTWLTLEKQRFGKRLVHHLRYRQRNLKHSRASDDIATPAGKCIEPWHQPIGERRLGNRQLQTGAQPCSQSVTDTGAGFDGPLETIFNREPWPLTMHQGDWKNFSESRSLSAVTSSG